MDRNLNASAQLKNAAHFLCQGLDILSAIPCGVSTQTKVSVRTPTATMLLAEWARNQELAIMELKWVYFQPTKTKSLISF